MAHDLTNLVQTKIVPRLYQQYSLGAYTSWMEANATALGGVYNGGKYVYFTELSVQGMANYNRVNGYVNGEASGSKIGYEMTQDRGRRFPIDILDYDETGALLSIGNVLSVYHRDWVIPEVDCYRISKLYADMVRLKSGNVLNDAISKATIIQNLEDDVATMKDKVGNIPLVIMMTGLTQRYFGREYIHNLGELRMNNGIVETLVKGIDDNPFYIVPSARMKSAYDFYDGVTAGQEAGGFVVAESAKDIKWIITPMNGPMAVMKMEKSRVFDPDTNQQGTAWAVDHRLHHELWMLPNAYNNTLIRTGAIS